MDSEIVLPFDILHCITCLSGLTLVLIEHTHSVDLGGYNKNHTTGTTVLYSEICSMLIHLFERQASLF